MVVRLIELNVPVEKIPYIRTIEGRKFKDGKWLLPDSAAQKLMQYGLLESGSIQEKKSETKYELSDYLYGYQKKICNTALNSGSFGIFSDTGTGKTAMGLEIANHYNKTIILCPLSVIETAWIDDCKRFYPNKRIVNVWGASRAQRIKNLNEPADIYVMNYDSFKILKG